MYEVFSRFSCLVNVTVQFLNKYTLDHIFQLCPNMHIFFCLVNFDFSIISACMHDCMFTMTPQSGQSLFDYRTMSKSNVYTIRNISSRQRTFLSFGVYLWVFLGYLNFNDSQLSGTSNTQQQLKQQLGCAVIARMNPKACF